MVLWEEFYRMMYRMTKRLTQEKVIETLKRELPYLIDHFGVKRIGLFGSFAKGIQKEDSDIDVFVEFEKPIGFKFMELSDYLEKILGKKVDIVTPEGIKSIRLKEVARDIERNMLYV